jgi:uncharacterized protein YgbK (DUF1537 family)
MQTTDLPQGPLVAWVGDDFTGAAAVMETLEDAGLPAVLFLDVPDGALLARFSGRRGIGIATDARTRDPDWMAARLPRAFAALQATGAPVVHYKVCSTMDSAPHVGSIGTAADLGFGAWIPCLIASPRIGRWQAFGTLFARHRGGIARLDRHPTMARHPVTPMTEADVRLHLAAQTAMGIGLVDLTDLAGDPAAALARERAAGARLVALDVVDGATLAAAGKLIWDARPCFAIGSQGVEDALIAHWHLPPGGTPKAGPVQGPVAVVSGSCAPETARQIAAAVSAGFRAVRLNAALTPDPRAFAGACAEAEMTLRAALAEGASVIIHSATGPDDPAIAAARAARAAAGQGTAEGAAILGAGLAQLLAAAHAAGALRLGVAGGDTSGAVTQALGVAALTMAAALVPAVPLLHAHRADHALPPLPLMLKGGQMGPEGMFVLLRDGAG